MSRLKPFGTRLSVNEGLIPIPSYKEWKDNNRFIQSSKITIQEEGLLQGWYFEDDARFSFLKKDEFNFNDDDRKPVSPGDYILGDSDTEHVILKSMEDKNRIYVVKQFELEQVKQKI